MKYDVERPEINKDPREQYINYDSHLRIKNWETSPRALPT